MTWSQKQELAKSQVSQGKATSKHAAQQNHLGCGCVNSDSLSMGTEAAAARQPSDRPHADPVRTRKLPHVSVLTVTCFKEQRTSRCDRDLPWQLTLRGI